MEEIEHSLNYVLGNNQRYQPDEEEDEVMLTLAKINPMAHAYTKFQESVKEYLSTYFDFDFDEFLKDEKNDPISDGVLNLMEAQFETGILDVRGVSQRIAAYLRKLGKI